MFLMSGPLIQQMFINVDITEDAFFSPNTDSCSFS